VRDADHPFFRPLWRRVALVLFCLTWTGFELWNGDGFWATMAGGMAAYAAWVFLLSYRPGGEAPTGTDSRGSNRD
jgi:hypothetical protein